MIFGPHIAGADADIGDNRQRDAERLQVQVIQDVAHATILVLVAAPGRAVGAVRQAGELVLAEATLDFEAQAVAEPVADAGKADEAGVDLDVRAADAWDARRRQGGNVDAR